jgi:hypothetical protein
MRDGGFSNLPFAAMMAEIAGAHSADRLGKPSCGFGPSADYWERSGDHVCTSVVVGFLWSVATFTPTVGTSRERGRK